MLNTIQMIFVVALPVFVLITVVNIISEVTSGKVEPDRAVRKERNQSVRLQLRVAKTFLFQV